MRAVVQRVSRSEVTVDGRTTGKINKGLLVLLGLSLIHISEPTRRS